MVRSSFVCVAECGEWTDPDPPCGDFESSSPPSALVIAHYEEIYVPLESSVLGTHLSEGVLRA